ncbi:CRISPR-associated protein, Csd2 family [Desulfocapsa sulfexigens DSM 10523]|uniref:CRISPR-associated protein, Csd2 family n=1 Tax=Desulfocapsa sulfexigens (strain DSM 10523 / SB164P1) TaxID=1167006 RepID=M1NKD7_DESSD|nr:type I-C CRISPR-associated protein Cas7/Csd2 [Desulfocapsa sulfexigens]AGF80044.1 CRISPR-associated protein, Csd2 family [Desulfocapsa sulfexigens DSM 10523]
MSEIIKNRYDFVLFFDVQDGNPNGDPDAGNLPRMDAETGFGLVTDVCLKRKIRNYVQLVKEAKRPFDIFIKEKAVLNNLIDEPYETDEVKKQEKSAEKVESARQWMCTNYYDIRTFGAVMSTGKNAGQVRGPVQLTFSRSVDPIIATEHSITRMAVTTEAEAEAQHGDNRTMGRKYTVPYGLYRAHGFISPHLASQTGFSEEDLELLWQALRDMFDHDHSAARGLMGTRKLIVFKHDSALGNASAQQLFEMVANPRLKDPANPARAFSDYTNIEVTGDLPSGVTVLEV